MVRRHSLPPHALKRQNSRFKIGAGVAAAAGSTVSTTTLLDPSHGEDEHDDETTTRLDPPLDGEEHDDSVEDAVLDPEPEGAEDPTAELRRLAEENAELRRQLAASKGGDA